MKKGLMVTLLTLIICIIFTMPALSSPIVIFNGRQLDFDVAPVIENDRTMVPLPIICKELGITLSGYGDKLMLTGEKQTTVLLLIGSDRATINNETRYLDAPIRIVNGETIVPIRFICEAYGITVIWEKNTQTVRITSAESALPVLTPSGATPGFPGYVGSIKTHKYHLRNCPEALHLIPGDVAVFNDKDEAEATGYERCSTCNP